MLLGDSGTIVPGIREIDFQQSITTVHSAFVC